MRDVDVLAALQVEDADVRRSSQPDAALAVDVMPPTVMI